MLNYSETGNKSYLILALLEFLKMHTDSEHPLEKQEIRTLMKRIYGISMSRNTLDEKLRALEDAGYEISKTDKGWYLVNDGITDGELRILIDSVLYSDILNQSYSKDLIGKLSELGSVSFKKYVRNLKYRTESIDKNKKYDIVNTIEIIQNAIFENKQISCNVITYRDDLIPRYVYDEDIIVNPYELAFSNGRYFLLCAKENEEKLSVLRIDRLDNVKAISLPAYEAEELKFIKKNGSIAEYIDKQPELCGGKLEMFTLACHRDALDDLYDAFGNRARIFTSFDRNYNDPDVVTLHVDTTRESIKYWAITHSDKIVVVSPQEVRDEISSSLKESQHVYWKTGRQPPFRAVHARNIKEALHECTINEGKRFFYNSLAKEPEMIDLRCLNEYEKIEEILLRNCVLNNVEFLSSFTNLKLLSLYKCEYSPELFKYCITLESLYLSNCCNHTAEYIKKMIDLRRVKLFDLRVNDLSFLNGCKKIHMLHLGYSKTLSDISEIEKLSELSILEIRCCENIKDYSSLKKLKKLRRVVIESEYFTKDDANELMINLPKCDVVIKNT